MEFGERVFRVTASIPLVLGEIVLVRWAILYAIGIYPLAGLYEIGNMCLSAICGPLVIFCGLSDGYRALFPKKEGYENHD